MNPHHIHQNMSYLPVLAEEGLKVINSYQGSVPMPPETYHHPQTSSQQAPYIAHHYQPPDQAYQAEDRMQGMYMGGGATPAPAEEIGMHGFLDNRAAGIAPFNQTQFLHRSAQPPTIEPKAKKKSKKGRPKKRTSDPKSWKRNKSKFLRNCGQTYVNSTGCLMPARLMKEPCKSCRQKCAERITEDQRQAIFDSYWDPSRDWTYRRLYIIDHALPQPIQRRRSRKDLDKTARRISFHYHLTVNGEKEKVCKKFFLNTLGVGEKFVIVSLHKRTIDGKVIPDRRGRHPAANQIPLEVKQQARRHIQAAITSMTPDQVNLTKLYESYCQECEMQDQEPVKKHFYRKLMNEELRISQQKLDDPHAVRNEERPLDYTPTPQVSALECLIKELWQKEQERRNNEKPKSSLKEKMKTYHSLRYAGKEYVNVKGQVRPSKKMKEPCDNCQKGCTSRISESQRQQLFDTFWDASKDWTEKKKYVLSCCESHPVLSSRMRGRIPRCAKRNRPLRFTYHFEVEGNKEPVCRKFFVNTLGLSNSFISSCFAKQDENGDFDPGKTTKCGTLAKLPPAYAKEIRRHIVYRCWADPNKAREYQTHSSTKGWSWNVSKMYEGYRQCCWNRGTKPASSYMYRRVFTEEMRIFHELEAEVPSTPSSATRSATKKAGDTSAVGKEAAAVQPSAMQRASSQRSCKRASHADDDGIEFDEEEEEEEEEEVETSSGESDTEYVPSGEDDNDDDDDDDDDAAANDDENYEPAPKKAVSPRSPVIIAATHQLEQQEGEPLHTEVPAPSKRRRQKWDTADMRCAGQTYVNDKGKVIPARKMKGPCQNCRKQCPEKVSHEVREKIFNMFWGPEMTWEKKRLYMESCIQENSVKKRTLPPSQLKLNRKVHMTYTLRLGNWEQNVCKLFFVNTLGISQKFAIVSMRKRKERLLRNVGLSLSPEVQRCDPTALEPIPAGSSSDIMSHMLFTAASSL